MNLGRTVFSQVIGFLPDREFRRCVDLYNDEQVGRFTTERRDLYHVNRKVNCNWRGAWAEFCLLIMPVPPSGRFSPG